MAFTYTDALATGGIAAGAGGAIWRFGSDLGGVWSRLYEARANAAMQRTGAALTRAGAQGRLADAESAMRYAGDVQRAGEEAAANRYLQLGQDVGRIYAGAAGGNIEVSSRSVRRADSAARLMAWRDASAVARSAAQQASAHVDQARAARTAYVADMANASMAEIAARYQGRIARSNAALGMWSAAGNMVSSLGSTALGAAAYFR